MHVHVTPYLHCVTTSSYQPEIVQLKEIVQLSERAPSTADIVVTRGCCDKQDMVVIPVSLFHLYVVTKPYFYH
jgi:hypothetical protein